MSEEEATAPVDTGQAAPAPVESWTSGFNDDLKGYVQNKGFKDPSALAESYRNLEKLRGVPADQIVQWPKDVSNREEMLPVYAKMGMPEKPDGYTRHIPDTFDAAAYSALAEKAHQLGLGDGQFQGLQEMFTEQAQSIIEQQDLASSQAFDEWRSSNPDGFHQAARVMAEIGMTEDQVEGVLAGDKRSLYDMLAKVGSRTSESQVIQGEAPNGGGFSMSPQAANTKIGELLGDESFMRQYRNSDRRIRDAAVKRMEELQKIANP